MGVAAFHLFEVPLLNFTMFYSDQLETKNSPLTPLTPFGYFFSLILTRGYIFVDFRERERGRE